jgi:hypothetical protein
LELEEEKAQHHCVHRVQHKHQNVQNILQLFRKPNSLVVSDDNFPDTLSNLFVVFESIFQVIFQAFELALNVFHVRSAENQDVYEENVDAVKS